MMSRPPRRAMLDQSAAKKSVFDKPYLMDSYHEMEHYQPPPFPRLNLSKLVFPPFPGPVPQVGGLRRFKGGKFDHSLGPDSPLWGGFPTWCSITCHSPLYCDGDIICKPNIYSGGEHSPKWEVFRNKTPYKNWKPISGGGIRIIAPDEDWTSWPDADADYVCVKYTDAAENVCESGVGKKCPWYTEAEFVCYSRCCPADITFEFDTGSNPTTIASGGNVDIYVLGGCAPYTYTCSGTGATWNSNGSTVLVSNNLNEQLDLADGD